MQKRKIGVTDKPRRRKLDANRLSHAIPAAIRREVWARDEGCCSFVGVDGHRCGETRGLEFAHAKPWAKGGEHSADNLCLRCRAHNAWEAHRDYGAGFMATKREKPWQVREPVNYDARFKLHWTRLVTGHAACARLHQDHPDSASRDATESIGRCLRKQRVANMHTEFDGAVE